MHIDETTQTIETVGFPLSPQQERILSLDSSHQVFPYVTQLKLAIAGTVDRGRLEKAVARLIAKHEILRTRFVPHPALRTLLQVITPEGSSAVETAQLLSEDAHNGLPVAHSGGPFNLSEGGLLRCVLAHFSPEKSDFYLTLPAICADAATMKIIARDLAAAYKNPDSSFLESAEIQYADVAEHFNSLLQSDLGSMGKQYWHPRLTGAQAPSLQPDGARTEMGRHFSPRVVHGRIDAEILAKAAGAFGSEFSEESFLLTCWRVLLAQLSGMSEFVVGCAAAGRDMPELEACAGLFERYLPIAGEAGSNFSFAEFLKKTAEALNEGLQWQNSFQWPEQESYHPVCFSFYDISWTFATGDATFSCACLNSCTDRFQVKLSCARSGDAIALELFYDPSVYSEESAGQIVEQFHTLTQSAGLAPQQPISELNAVSQKERQRLIRQFSSSDAILGFEDVVARFEQQAGSAPESTALVCNQKRLSYGELNQKANQLAHYLAQMGIGPETRIAICMERSAEMVVALLGVLKAGGAYIPLDPAHPSERMAYMLKDADLALVLTEEHLAQRLPQAGATIVPLDREWNAVATHSSSNPQVRIAEQNLAYVIYTSGSTGRPKGVAVTRQGLANYVNWACRAYEFQSGSCSPLYSSIGFDLTVTSLWPCLVAGGSVVVATEAQGIDAIAQFAAEIQTYDVLKITPAHLQMLKSVLPEAKAGISRRFVIGGEALNWNDLSYWRKHAPGTRLINEYGPTETVVGSCIYEVHEVGEPEGQVPVGRPIASTQVYVLNQNGELCATGAPGELYIGGAGLARGYLNHPELTAERFIPDSFSQWPGERLYRTGDLARWRADGQLIFLGRLDDQVKIRGYRIELGEIEGVLQKEGNLEHAVVVAREEPSGEKKLVAYLVEREPVNTHELGDKIKHFLPEYMVPSVFVVMNELPLTRNGKIDRRALPAPTSEHTIRRNRYVAPGTPVEEIMAGIWEDVLRLPQVSLEDNFFELGGHSLLATQVISRVRASFGVDLPLRQVFESPMVKQLAADVEKALLSDHGQVPQKAGQAARTSRISHHEQTYAAPQTRGEEVVAEISADVLKRDQVSVQNNFLGLPLSYAQQGLWFIQQLEPDSVAYNVPLVLRIHGPLDVKGLRTSLEDILRRHESLRTRFVTIQGEPYQVIDDHSYVEMPLISLASLSEERRDAELRGLAQSEAQKPFALDQGPLLRAKLLEMEERHHVLLITMHHIITDGWSMPILLRELIEFYRASVSGEKPRLQELAIQYADFAVWQRQWLTGDLLDREADYWKQRLQGMEPLDLPADHGRFAGMNHTVGAVPVTFPAELTAKLKELGRREGATLFMTLMAGFQVLLGWYANQDDVAVGTDIANRSRGETEGLIGFFVNQLVIRTSLAGNPGFAELLQQVRKTSLEAYTHQHLPFSKLVELLAPGRSSNRSSFVEVKFVLLNTPDQDSPRADLEQLGNLKIEVENSMELHAKFDVLLTLSEVDGQLKGNIEYRSELFEKATIEMLRARLQGILETVAQDPKIGVDALQEMLEHSDEIAMRNLSSMKLDAMKRKEASPATISG